MVRALRAHQGTAADASLWSGAIAREYRRMLMSQAVEKTKETKDSSGKTTVTIVRKGIPKQTRDEELAREGEVPFAKTLRHRIRYFTDGAVIGSRAFVDEAFMLARERSGPKRKDGARKPRGAAAPLAGILWSFRDLQAGIMACNGFLDQ